MLLLAKRGRTRGVPGDKGALHRRRKVVHQGQHRKLAHSRSGERGAGKLKAIVVTVIIAFLVLVAVRTVPPYVAEYQLSDKMDETARFAVVNNYNADQIRDTIYKEVQDLDIPAERDDIKVEASRAKVKISLDYRVPVDLLVYHAELHFTPSAENKNII
jgi:hypothetical protein